MSILVDTGVLSRMFLPTDPAYSAIRHALRTIRMQGSSPATTFQNIAEFWNVSTRPLAARGGYGLSPQMMGPRVALIERRFQILTESASSFQKWRELVAKHEIQGVAVHDARLVATLLSAGVHQILTLNSSDFRRYETDGIQVIAPIDV